MMKFLVYGTLRPGQHAYRAFGLDHKATHLDTVRIEGTMYHLGGYPGIKLDGNPEGFVADLFETEDMELMQRLDGYESYDPANEANSLYLRKEIEIADVGAAFIYEYNRGVAKAPRLESGDWTSRSI